MTDYDGLYDQMLTLADLYELVTGDKEGFSPRYVRDLDTTIGFLKRLLDAAYNDGLWEGIDNKED